MVSGIPDSLSCIPESKARDFGIPQATHLIVLVPQVSLVKRKKFYYSFHIYLIKFQITFHCSIQSSESERSLNTDFKIPG